MAESYSEEERIVTLRGGDCSVNNLLTETTSRARDRRMTGRRRRKWKFRGIGSRSLLLIIVWEFILSCSLSITLDRHLYVSSIGLQGMYFLGLAVLSVSLPLASLLAEVVIGRYKLVSYSLRVMWLLSICESLMSLMNNSTLPVTKSILFQISLSIPQFVCFGAFLAGAIPLGIDQITTGSNSNISAFIQWLLCMYFIGVAIPNLLLSVAKTCTHWPASTLNMMSSLVPVLLLSVGLILDFLLSHKLVREPVTVNPVTLIFKVLKYAAKHKHPVRRSAFTYCENERPSRLDNGKYKYGGPFTTEQVEDVKTFWRILLVIFAIPILAVTLGAHVNYSYNKYWHNYCHRVLLSETTSPYFFTMYLIPLYELLVYPCLRNRGPRILQSVGIGAAALVISSLYGLTAETVQYFVNKGTVQCFYYVSDICFFAYIPFNFILGFSTIVICKSSIEFICAQAPYNMRGILIGIWFIACIIFVIPGVVLYGLWTKWIAHVDRRRYGIWFYLTTLVLAVVSSLLLGCVVRRYKPRERDEITRSQTMVEDIYIKYQEQEAKSSS